MVLFIFTTLHVMQTQSTMRILSVCPSVCQAWIVTKRKKNVTRFLYHTSFSLVFWEKEWYWGRPLQPEILGQAAPTGAISPILNR